MDLFPAEMRAIVILDPEEEKTLPTIRATAERGIVGVRYFPVNIDDKVAWFGSEKSVAVWALCDELGLAVNTVAKAYRELEAAGVLETHGRAGSFIALSRDAAERSLQQAASAYAARAAELGIDPERAARFVRDALDRS